MDALLRRHYDRIFALCRRVTGSDADGADAAQEALIAIVRGLPRFDGRARFSTWAYRVATNVCLDELRRQRRRPVPGLGDGRRSGRGRPDGRRPSARRSRRRSHRHRCGTRHAAARLPCGCRAARRLPARLRRDQPGARHPARNGSLAHRPRQGGRGRRARREPRSPDPSSYWVAMSDQSLSRDELASALLDGEVAGPSSVDPALAARVEELRRAAEAIGAPVPIDDIVREHAIEAALAEFDAPATSEPADVAAAAIATTAALPRRSRWLPALAGAAAAVVVLIGAVAVLQRDDSSSTDAASVAEQSPAAGREHRCDDDGRASPRRARTRRARRRHHRTRRCRLAARSRRDLRRRPAARGPGAGAVHEHGGKRRPRPLRSRGTSQPSRASSASSPEA